MKPWFLCHAWLISGTYGNTYEAQYKTCKDADAQEQENQVAIKALQGEWNKIKEKGILHAKSFGE